MKVNVQKNIHYQNKKERKGKFLLIFSNVIRFFLLI